MSKPTIADALVRHELRDRLTKLRDDLNEHVGEHPALSEDRAILRILTASLRSADEYLIQAQGILEIIEGYHTEAGEVDDE